MQGIDRRFQHIPQVELRSDLSSHPVQGCQSQGGLLCTGQQTGALQRNGSLVSQCS